MLKAHFFICTNVKKDGTPCCADKGGQALRDRLKQLCKQQSKHVAEEIRINASGCLGQCKRGITAVLYPEGKWYTELTSNEETAQNLYNDLVQQISKQA